jgi:hypothetical protein
MNSNNRAFNESELVLCRSGYTTIMDLAKLEKKGILYPYTRTIRTTIFSKKIRGRRNSAFSFQEEFKIVDLSKWLTTKDLTVFK